MIEICALASGSNGNCYYIGNSKDAVLIDAGISTKQILLRMQQRKLDSSKIRALFISHEHIDHVRGARVLCKKLDIPVYLTTGTYLSIKESDRPQHVELFSAGETITIEDFHIYSFAKKHDASEPCSFRVEYGKIQVGVFTDIGEPCENVLLNLPWCQALFIESNYDEQMLWNGFYPYPLKQRVASSVGHLSNEQAAQLVGQYAGAQLEYVILSHLSKENNTPEKAYQSFSELHDKYKVQLSNREQASDVFILK